jgi:subtilisin
MKKSISVFIAFFFLAVFVLATQAGAMDIPAADPAKEHSRAPEHSPVINEDWQLTRYYIFSDVPALKVRFGVNHEFPRAFSTVLTPLQVEELLAEGIVLEPVQLYRLTGKPVCGDGVCQGNEPKTCSADCAIPPDPDPEPDRTCFPSNQVTWGVSTVNGGSGGAGVRVAVLDSGIRTDHLDLAQNVVDCRDTTKRRIRKGCNDNVGHGTHVAGTIGANGGTDGQGIYGVAPEAQLMGIKVCGSAFCWGDDIAEGIYYAADSGANIVSMSLGGDLPDSIVLQAIDYAVSRDVLVIAAAGNDGPGTGSIDYPGAYNKVVAVGAIDVNISVPSWSSRGINDGDYFMEEREVELAAPGVYVESTYNDGCYAYKSGTSMATPHVSGLAAKLWQGNAVHTRNLLHTISADIWLTGDDTATGFGLPIAP